MENFKIRSILKKVKDYLSQVFEDQNTKFLNEKEKKDENEFCIECGDQ